MHNLSRIALMGFLLLSAMILFASSTAFAQIDLVGEWAPQFHEDQPERVAGPPVLQSSIKLS